MKEEPISFLIQFLVASLRFFFERIILNFRGKAKNKYVFPTLDNSFDFLWEAGYTFFGACFYF